jgi:hypothetical protein
MKKYKLWVLPVVMLVLSLVLAATAGAGPPPRDQGCTPGYWKNHMDRFVAGDYYIVKLGNVDPAGDYYIVKLRGDYYIVKLAGDYYIVKLEGENAIDRLAGDYYIVKLASEFHVVELLAPDILPYLADHYQVNLAGDYYIVKGAMVYPGGTGLLGALKARGHGSELLRHGAAAALNATNPGVDYGLTADEVIAYFLAGNAAPLVEANEQFCPLD